MSIDVGVFETSIFVHQWHINWKDSQVDPIGRVRSHLPSGDKWFCASDRREELNYKVENSDLHETFHRDNNNIDYRYFK